MKILYVIIDLESGGAQEALYQFLKEQDIKKFNPSVISLSGRGSLARKIEKIPVPVYSVNLRNAFLFFFGVVKFIYLVLKIKPDVIHSWIYHANLAALLMKFLARKKVVWSIRCSDADFTKYGLISAAAVKLSAMLSFAPDGIIYNSFAGLKSHRALGFGGSNQTVIQNGVDTCYFAPVAGRKEELRKKYGLQGDSAVVGMASRFDPMKDFDTLFEAFSKIRSARKNVFLAMCGGGIVADNVYLSELIEKNNLGDSVKLLGFMEDMREFYAMLDIFVLSSKSEGFPNVLAEAMACGLPCVSTDAGDAKIILGDAGDAVAKSDAFALAGELEKLLEKSAEERREIGAAGRERIKKMFPLAKFRNETEKYYTCL